MYNKRIFIILETTIDLLGSHIKEIHSLYDNKPQAQESFLKLVQTKILEILTFLQQQQQKKRHYLEILERLTNPQVLEFDPKTSTFTLSNSVAFEDSEEEQRVWENVQEEILDLSGWRYYYTFTYRDVM